MHELLNAGKAAKACVGPQSYVRFVPSGVVGSWQQMWSSTHADKLNSLRAVGLGL